MANVWIRSYNDYAHDFRVTGGVIVVPPRMAQPKNIVEVTPEQLDELKKNDIFAALLGAKVQQFKILDSLPRDALDMAEKLAAANDEAEAARVEKIQALGDAQKAREELDELKKKVEEQGGIDSVSEEVDKAREEAKKAREEAENLAGELAALKASIAKKAKADKAE